MKNVKPLIIVLAALIVAACGKSYLDKRPLGDLDESALANKKGVERLLIGAYSLLDGIGGPKSGWFSAASNWIYGSVCGSEAYKSGQGSDDQQPIAPLELFTVTANNEAIASKWATVYDGVQRANDVLRVMKKATDIPLEDQKRIAAEARFLRAHYHFEAKKMWNDIPYVDETVTYGSGNEFISNTIDAWPAIEKDLIYAIENLNDVSYAGAVGRANKYTALALLAKAYMFQKKYAEAKPLLVSIIQSGKYKLVNYADNFNPASRNSDESIFSAQMSVTEGDGGMNGNYGDVLNFTNNGGPGTCCGFFSPSQFLVNHFKTNSFTGLPDLDHFNDSDVWNDDGKKSSDPFNQYEETLDPRLDWTVGRRGIPYLDWGLHPGDDWIRNQLYGGPYSPKKNVYSKEQQGKLSGTTGWGADGITANNVNLIRYADILLWAAEVEIEIGSLEKAREYVNLIRERASRTDGWVKNPNGKFAPYAANYKVGLYQADDWTNKEFARKALRYERMLELGMEGHRFFDLVRWGIAAEEIMAYAEKEKLKRDHLIGLNFKKGCNEYFPIPQREIDLSGGKMVQTRPCY